MVAKSSSLPVRDRNRQTQWLGSIDTDTLTSFHGTTTFESRVSFYAQALISLNELNRASWTALENLPRRTLFEYKFHLHQILYGMHYVFIGHSFSSRK